MNTIKNTHKLTPLQTGTLPCGTGYRLVCLSAVHAAACAGLHAATIEGLAPDEKSYMLGKDRHYFAAHLHRPHGNTVIGVVSRNRLIAQAMIVHPDIHRPATGMVDMPPVNDPHSVSIMQAVSVHPRFRGKNLMEIMAREWVNHAAAHGRTDLLAEIHVDNRASWSTFLRAGLNLVSIGHDPSDGTIVYNAHEKTAAARAKSLTPTFNRYAGLPQAHCAPVDIDGQSRLMADGYAITGQTPDKQAFILTRLRAPGL